MGSLEETGEKLSMKVRQSMKWRLGFGQRSLMRKARCKVWAGGQGNRDTGSKLQEVPRVRGSKWTGAESRRVAGWG